MPKYRLTVITPTADRPVAFRLCEQWMARQTWAEFNWVVVDNGAVPVVPTQGQRHIYRGRAPDTQGFSSLGINLAMGLASVDTDYVAIIEDDDYYYPSYLEDMMDKFICRGVSMVGDGQQRYYNVEHRMYRLMQNRGAALCQTGFHKSIIPPFMQIIKERLAAQSYGFDTYLWDWAAATGVQSVIYSAPPITSVGIKGIPGIPGLGIGHRPMPDGVNGWVADPQAKILRELCGEDASIYEAFYKG